MVYLILIRISNEILEKEELSIVLSWTSIELNSY